MSGNRFNLIIKKTDISVFFLTLLCVTFLSPLILRTIGTVGVLALAAVYFLLEADHLFHINIQEKNTLILIGLYVAMLLLYTFLGKSDEGAGQTGAVLFMISFILIIPIYKRLNKKHCIFIIAACTATIMITLFQNYLLYVRLGNRISQQLYKVGYKEVVNTQYVSALMLFSGVLFSVFLCEPKKLVKFGALFITAVCFGFNILVTQRAITTILSFVLFFLLILVKGEMSKKKIIRYIIFLLLIMLLFLQYDAIIGFVADLFDSPRLKSRFDSILGFLSTGSIDNVEEGSLTVRIRLIGVSIKTFWSSISNFLFGVGEKIDYSVVGNHSQFFDEFAKFGIFGGLLSCTIFIKMSKIAKRISTIEKNDYHYKMLTVIFVVMVMRALIGGVFSPPIGIIMFIFMPISFKVMKLNLIEKKEGMIKHENLRFDSTSLGTGEWREDISL